MEVVSGVMAFQSQYLRPQGKFLKQDYAMCAMYSILSGTADFVLMKVISSWYSGLNGSAVPIVSEEALTLALFAPYMTRPLFSSVVDLLGRRGDTILLVPFLAVLGLAAMIVLVQGNTNSGLVTLICGLAISGVFALSTQWIDCYFSRIVSVTCRKTEESNEQRFPAGIQGELSASAASRFAGFVSANMQFWRGLGSGIVSVALLFPALAEGTLSKSWAIGLVLGPIMLCGLAAAKLIQSQVRRGADRASRVSVVELESGSRASKCAENEQTSMNQAVCQSDASIHFHPYLGIVISLAVVGLSALGKGLSTALCESALAKSAQACGKSAESRQLGYAAYCGSIAAASLVVLLLRSMSKQTYSMTRSFLFTRLFEAVRQIIVLALILSVATGHVFQSAESTASSLYLFAKCVDGASIALRAEFVLHAGVRTVSARVPGCKAASVSRILPGTIQSLYLVVYALCGVGNGKVFSEWQTYYAGALIAANLGLSSLPRLSPRFRSLLSMA